MDDDADNGKGSDPDAAREEQVTYILRHARKIPRLRGARPVDLDYVDGVLTLYYACLTGCQGAVEVPQEEAPVHDTAGCPKIDAVEEARFVLERLQAEHGIAPGRRRRLTRRLVEAVLDCQVEFLVSKGIAFEMTEEERDGG